MGLQHGPNIINGELVFCIDAANPKSYISGSSDILNIKDTTITGSAEGGLAFSSDNAGVWNFDGVDDYIEFGNVDSSNILSLFDTPCTISTWVAADLTGDSYQRIIDKSNGTSGQNGYSLSFPNSTSPDIGFYINTSQVLQYTIPSYTAGQWVNIVVTKSGNNHILYVNGTSVDTDTSTNPIPSTTTGVRVGTWSTTGREFNGKIPNISIYHKALSAQEVKQNYNALKGRFEL